MNTFITMQGRIAFPTDVPLHVTVFRYDIGRYVDDEYRYADIERPAFFQHAVPRRRAEYLAGRIAARAELTRWGQHDAQVGTGHLRAPLWPEGLVGSISHTADLAAAVVHPCAVFRSIGMDIEPLMDADTAVSLGGAIATPQELATMSGRFPAQAVALTALFSLKESYFKCISPRLSGYLDFLDVQVVLENDGKTYRAGPSASYAASGMPLPDLRGHCQTWQNSVVVSLVTDPGPPGTSA